MSTIHFGNGQPITSLNAALTAAANGDTIVSHGPHTDTVPTVVWIKDNITWNHAGDDYTFDGLLATNDCIDIQGDGNILNISRGSGRVLITGYAQDVLTISGNNNAVHAPYLSGCGVAINQLRCIYVTGDNNTVNDITIRAMNDGQDHAYGVYLSGCDGTTIRGATISGLQTTGAVKDVFGVYSTGTKASDISDISIASCTATREVGGFYGNDSGSVAGQLSTVSNLRFQSTNLGAVVTRAVELVRGSFDVFNCIAYGIAGSSTGIYLSSQQHDPNRPYTQIANCVAYGLNRGVYQQASGGVDVKVRVKNCISLTCVTTGFDTFAGSPHDSDNNCAYDCGTNYGGNWNKGASDLDAVNPLFTDAATYDFTLQSTSPCIDTGTDVTGRTADFAGNTESGNSWDIGAYEYQWSYPIFDAGMELLPSQYEDSTYLIKLLEALSGKTAPKIAIEQLEEVFQELRTDLWIANASGIQLDNLGKILGRLRGGMTDTEYRGWLYLQAAINTSQGLAEQIYQILIQWLDPLWIHLTECSPDFAVPPVDIITAKAYVYMKMKTSGTIPDNITDMVQKIAAGGVGVWVVSSDDETPFGFDGDSLADGFDEVDAFHVPEGNGGALAELYPHLDEV